MDKAIQLFFRGIEGLLVILLTCMVVMVFGNVVLRYGFNSGIVTSEELSRFFFVWLTFLGAVVTFYENSHIGVETFVQILGRGGRIICMFASNIVILICCAIFFWGTWKQFNIMATMSSPVTGLSLAWIYGIGFFTGAGIGLITLVRLIRIALGLTSEEELARFAGTSDAETKAKEQAE